VNRPGVRTGPVPFQLAEWQARTWAPAEDAEAGERYLRWLQEQLHKQPRQGQDLAHHCHRQAQLLDLLAALSSGLACREPVGILLAEALRGVLDLAGITRGALLVRIEPGATPQIISRGFRPQEVHLIHAALEGWATSGPASSGPDRSLTAERSSELLGQLVEVESTTFAPLSVADDGLGMLFLASDSRSLEDDSWQWFTSLIAAQIGQTLSLGQALGKLGASEQRYRAVMENANDGIFVLNADGVILESNAQGASLLSGAGGPVLGRPFTDFLVQDHAGGHRQRFLELLSDGNLHTDHVEVQGPGGAAVAVDISARNTELDGQAAVIAITHEVTQRNRLEAQLCQWQKMEGMGRLASSVSHDFNNILAVILANASILLKDMAEGDPRRESALGVKAGADLGVALVRQLLDFTRMGQEGVGTVPLNTTVTALVPLLRRLVGLTIKIDTRLEARPGNIAANAAQIEQVIMNLAVNARDAMPAGGQLGLTTADVDLRGALAHDGQNIPDGSYVLLAVTDTGAGMDTATQQQIFQPFFTTKPVGQGTGLGLSTCQMIVHRCHGFIALSSAPAAGTSFQLYFPRP
jgi:PAS domain S-box-containing protein